MQSAAQAYSRTAQTAVSPRQLEASLLMRAAARLQMVMDSWSADIGAMEDALTFNRKLWSILVVSATKQDNPLPDLIKQNIANLGVFIFQRTVELQLEPEQRKLEILITINREIAAGLQAA